jgi:hypothetical protein
MTSRKLTKEQLKSLVVEARSDIFSDRWRGGEGMGSERYPSKAKAPSETRDDWYAPDAHPGEFSSGKTMVLEGIELIKDSLDQITDQKVRTSIVRLLDRMIGQVESIEDAYRRLVREQEGSSV